MVLTRTTTGWAISLGPSGMPVRAAVVGTQLWVTTVTAAGAAATLW